VQTNSYKRGHSKRGIKHRVRKIEMLGQNQRSQGEATLLGAVSSVVGA